MYIYFWKLSCRCLLSRDFVRLGKWFVQPYDGPKKNMGARWVYVYVNDNSYFLIHVQYSVCMLNDVIYYFSTTHLSFSFAFFVHGESTVCASVDVRQHPPVRRLSKSHLLQAQSSTTGLQGKQTISSNFTVQHTSYNCWMFVWLKNISK